MADLLVEVTTAPQAPTKGTPLAAGWDCYAPTPGCVRPGETAVIPLGIKLAPSIGLTRDTAHGHDFMVELRGRSSLAAQGVLTHVGTIDADYRGEVSAIVTNLGGAPFEWRRGDRVCQLVVVPLIPVEMRRVERVEADTERGDGAMGSTGR